MNNFGRFELNRWNRSLLRLFANWALNYCKINYSSRESRLESNVCCIRFQTIISRFSTPRRPNSLSLSLYIYIGSKSFLVSIFGNEFKARDKKGLELCVMCGKWAQMYGIREWIHCVVILGSSVVEPWDRLSSAQRGWESTASRLLWNQTLILKIHQIIIK